MNPLTGKSSTIETEFSAQNWNSRTLRHLKDVHALGEARFNQVFNMASNSRPLRGRMRAVTNPEPTSNDLDDSDDTLQSEDNNEGNNEVLQGHENRLEGDEIGGDDQDMHGDEHGHENGLEGDEMKGDDQDMHGDEHGHENGSEDDGIEGDQDMHGDEDTGNYSAGALDGYEGVYSDYY